MSWACVNVLVHDDPSFSQKDSSSGRGNSEQPARPAEREDMQGTQLAELREVLQDSQGPGAALLGRGHPAPILPPDPNARPATFGERSHADEEDNCQGT